MRMEDWERRAAALMAMVINGWAVWALSTAMQPTAPADIEPAVLDAVWVARPAPAPSESAAPPTPARARSARVPAPATPAPRRSEAAASPMAAVAHAPPAARPLSAVYLAQARQWARAEAGVPATTQDPLADRFVQLPGKAAQRFRMRQPMSPARAVAMVGQLFGGNDPGEPCRSNRAQIAALGTAGDGAALQRELDFERRWCRP